MFYLLPDPLMQVGEELTQSSNKVPDRKWLVCSSEPSGQETGLPGDQN